MQSRINATLSHMLCKWIRGKKKCEALMQKINVSILIMLGTCGDMEACRYCLPYVS